VLFSQERVADYINNTFEPVWETVRPVPIVRIDFGDGNVLTRTLHGNILTSVCTAEGQILDALPGIYEEQTYLEQLNQLRLLARATAKQPADGRAAWVKAYHRHQAEAIKKDQPPDQFVEKRKVAPLTKAAIERSVEIVLQPAPKEKPQPQAQEPAPPKPPANVVKEDAGLWKALLEDTQLNESTRRRQIHELLAKEGMVKPEKVTKPIYKDVLHADLDDPYLGLGKTLFANYPFAAEDAKR
jgi:hypothetical protein